MRAGCIFNLVVSCDPTPDVGSNQRWHFSGNFLISGNFDKCSHFQEICLNKAIGMSVQSTGKLKFKVFSEIFGTTQGHLWVMIYLKPSMDKVNTCYFYDSLEWLMWYYKHHDLIFHIGGGIVQRPPFQHSC